MASLNQMKDPLKVGKAIRAQLEHEIPQDLPLERDFRENSEYTITDHVRDLHAKLCPDPRTLELINGLVGALHSFARATKPSHDEWLKTIDFLTRAGKESTPAINQFILLSDCLGISVLLDELEHPKPIGCTEGCEPGPFFDENAPFIESGGALALNDTTGEHMFFSGSVKDIKGNPIPGAIVNVWQSDGDGFYDVNSPSPSPVNNRGKIKTLQDGTLRYRGILPTAYPIPGEGPAGEFLKAMGRHPHRAAHLHFHITASGFGELTTALYPSHSPFLGTDPVFATRKSLICELREEKDISAWRKMGYSENEALDILNSPEPRVWVWTFDFVLPTVEAVQDLKIQMNNRIH